MKSIFRVPITTDPDAMRSQFPADDISYSLLENTLLRERQGTIKVEIEASQNTIAALKIMPGFEWIKDIVPPEKWEPGPEPEHEEMN
jgi:hypothetical protein